MEMIPKDSFPGYFRNIEVDPSDIDINIHPTKTEVNFLDVKLVYAILHAAVRKAIGLHNLSPTIDFTETTDPNIDFGEASKATRPFVMPHVLVNEFYNPFNQAAANQESKPKWNDFPQHHDKPLGDWRQLYGERTEQPINNKGMEAESDSDATVGSQYLQVNQSYIITTVKSGILLIDQHLAHMRVLFEKYLKQMENHNGISQQELFPQALSLNLNDASLLKELLPELENLGFVLEQANPTTFMINGTPSDSAGSDAVELVEKILDNYKINRTDLQLDRKLNLAKTMAAQLAVKTQTRLSEPEMQNLVDQLFACNVSEIAPNGKKTYVIIGIEELKGRLG
jgi:DNA mismatch repair protein MutL